jgi:hypothetical protein
MTFSVGYGECLRAALLGHLAGFGGMGKFKTLKSRLMAGFSLTDSARF